MRAASIALIGAALIGWAVASSPLLEGPFAEPKPSAAPAARYTAAPTERIDPAGVFTTIRCAQPGSMMGTTVFVNGHSVAFERPITLSPWSCGAPIADTPMRPSQIRR